MTGCVNLNAINYNPSASEDDYSCLYHIAPVGGSTHYFHDYKGLVDNSFTMSFSAEGKSWVFFHDYIPDFYLHTREQLWTLKDQRLYKHNAGPHGLYYKDDPESFFVDVVFKSDSDLLLETVSWITEVLADTVESEWETITHISIWNSQQHTGRIRLEDVFDKLQYKTSRRTQGEWSFDDFRNVLLDRGPQFLMDIFHNYALIPEAAGDKGWYDQELMEDKYFVVRFEHDNTNDKEVILHQTNIQVIKSDR